MAVPTPERPLATLEQMRAYLRKIQDQPCTGALFHAFPIFKDFEPRPEGATQSITVTMLLPPNVKPGGMQNDGDQPLTIFASHEDGGGKVVLQPGERCVWPTPPKAD